MWPVEVWAGGKDLNERFSPERGAFSANTPRSRLASFKVSQQDVVMACPEGVCSSSLPSSAPLSSTISPETSSAPAYPPIFQRNTFSVFAQEKRPSGRLYRLSRIGYRSAFQPLTRLISQEKLQVVCTCGLAMPYL